MLASPSLLSDALLYFLSSSHSLCQKTSALLVLFSGRNPRTYLSLALSLFSLLSLAPKSDNVGGRPERTPHVLIIFASSLTGVKTPCDSADEPLQYFRRKSGEDDKGTPPSHRTVLKPGLLQPHRGTPAYTAYYFSPARAVARQQIPLLLDRRPRSSPHPAVALPARGYSWSTRREDSKATLRPVYQASTSPFCFGSCSCSPSSRTPAKPAQAAQLRRPDGKGRATPRSGSTMPRQPPRPVRATEAQAGRLSTLPSSASQTSRLNSPCAPSNSLLPPGNSN